MFRRRFLTIMDHGFGGSRTGFDRDPPKSGQKVGFLDLPKTQKTRFCMVLVQMCNSQIRPKTVILDDFGDFGLEAPDLESAPEIIGSPYSNFGGFFSFDRFDRFGHFGRFFRFFPVC